FRSRRRCGRKSTTAWSSTRWANFARYGQRAIPRDGILIGGRLMRSSDSSTWRLGRKAIGCFRLTLLALLPPPLARPAAAQEPAKPAGQPTATEPKEKEAPAGKVT